MKVVILCGGRGTRLNEQTYIIPKPMVPVGDKPILWHIMKLYSFYGFSDFILCIGYRGDIIKDHFSKNNEGWNIEFSDAGVEALTGKRVRAVEPMINTENFLLTYGDGLSNINIKKSVEFHKKLGKITTLAAIQPASRFGILEIEGNIATGFREKPKIEDWVNGGFYTFSKKIFGHLDDNMLEETTLPNLAKLNELAVFRHEGFWQCMDTYRDCLYLNEMWKEKKTPWKVW